MRFGGNLIFATKAGRIPGGCAMGRMLSILAVLLAAAVIRPAAAQEYVDLELVLAVDVSGSVDDEEALLQRQGYIAAFRDPEVIRTIQGGMLGRIAVSYYEWAGFGHIRHIAGWTLVEDGRTANTFADVLSLTAPQTARRTAISSAINFAVPYFENNGFEGTRRVVDISGDGANNWGEFITVARDRAVAAGVTINGLPIMNSRPGPGGWPQVRNLDLYYRDCVIGGPGAFIVVANSFQEFATAIRQKLITEIAGMRPLQPMRLIPAAQHSERAAPPCDIGEQRRLDYDDY